MFRGGVGWAEARRRIASRRVASVQPSPHRAPRRTRHHRGARGAARPRPSAARRPPPPGPPGRGPRTPPSAAKDLIRPDHHAPRGPRPRPSPPDRGQRSLVCPGVPSAVPTPASPVSPAVSPAPVPAAAAPPVPVVPPLLELVPVTLLVTRVTLGSALRRELRDIQGSFGLGLVVKAGVWGRVVRGGRAGSGLSPRTEASAAPVPVVLVGAVGVRRRGEAGLRPVRPGGAACAEAPGEAMAVPTRRDATRCVGVPPPSRPHPETPASCQPVGHRNGDEPGSLRQGNTAPDAPRPATHMSYRITSRAVTSVRIIWLYNSQGY